MEITLLPNIGKTLAEKLKKLNINTAENIENWSTEDIFIKLKTIDPEACINMLYAIEGAKQNIRWHGLSKSRKTELQDFFRTLQNQI